MGIKETLRNNPVLTGTIAALICVGAIGSLVWQFSGQSADHERPPPAFYSADDGKTWFLDSVRKATPFDHDGSQAYSAVLYRCAGGKPFVGYLQKWPGGLPTDDPPEVKTPGDSRWVSATLPGGGRNPNYAKATNPKCPDGSNTAPTRVSIFDPDVRQ